MPTKEENYEKASAIGILENIKRHAGPLIRKMPSNNMRDRARKIYDLAKELQDDLAK